MQKLYAINRWLNMLTTRMYWIQLKQISQPSNLSNVNIYNKSSCGETICTHESRRIYVSVIRGFTDKSAVHTALVAWPWCCVPSWPR